MSPLAEGGALRACPPSSRLWAAPGTLLHVAGADLALVGLSRADELPLSNRGLTTGVEPDPASIAGGLGARCAPQWGARGAKPARRILARWEREGQSHLAELIDEAARAGSRLTDIIASCRGPTPAISSCDNLRKSAARTFCFTTTKRASSCARENYQSWPCQAGA